MSAWPAPAPYPPTARRSRSRSPYRAGAGPGAVYPPRPPYPDPAYPDYRADWDAYERDRAWANYERERAVYEYGRRGRSHSPGLDEGARDVDDVDTL